MLKVLSVLSEASIQTISRDGRLIFLTRGFHAKKRQEILRCFYPEQQAAKQGSQTLNGYIEVKKKMFEETYRTD